MDCLNCGNYATKVYVNDEGVPCFLCASCADAWELGYWYGQNHPETFLARIDEYDDAENLIPNETLDNLLSGSLTPHAVV